MAPEQHAEFSNNVSYPDRDLGRGQSRPRSVKRQDFRYDGLTLTAEKEDAVSMRIQGVCS
jgi:hypothetical protein